MIGRWRSHVHVTAQVRVPEEQTDGLFTALADAAHDLDEEIICTGSFAHAPIARFDVVGYRMRRRAGEALRDRVVVALRQHQPHPTETRVVCTPRCRCNGDRGDIDVGGLLLLAFVVAVVLCALGVFGPEVAP